MSSPEYASEDGTVSLDEVIRGFINTNEYLHEYRLQKLVYLAELLSLRDRDWIRLTTADFKPYMYGAYSDELSERLDELKHEFSTKADTHHGKVVTAYTSPDSDPNLDDDILKLIEEANQMVRNGRFSNEELAEWSKSTLLYEYFPFGEKMDFSKYGENKERLSKDLSKLEQ
ncbi:SocA family protein [Salinirubrum litoreum]|uniref:Antitoxin SocA-like Panacea domain-containing protein n=1 Tax=Salinirubrum litoreum TaxID=1126234 RepID=A0ABD5R6Z7_9EURY|nr:SocA family protein [Salinirubrum litoreum]